MGDNYLTRDFDLFNFKKQFERSNIETKKGVMNEDYHKNFRGRQVCFYRALTAIPMGIVQRVAAVCKSAFALIQEIFVLLGGHTSSKDSQDTLFVLKKRVRQLFSNATSIVTGVLFGLVMQTVRYTLGIFKPSLVYHDVSKKPEVVQQKKENHHDEEVEETDNKEAPVALDSLAPLRVEAQIPSKVEAPVAPAAHLEAVTEVVQPEAPVIEQRQQHDVIETQLPQGTPFVAHEPVVTHEARHTQESRPIFTLAEDLYDNPLADIAHYIA